MFAVPLKNGARVCQTRGVYYYQSRLHFVVQFIEVSRIIGLNIFIFVGVLITMSSYVKEHERLLKLFEVD